MSYAFWPTRQQPFASDPCTLTSLSAQDYRGYKSMLGGKKPFKNSPTTPDLYASAELLRVMTATSPECIKVVASDTRLLEMNPAGLAMIGAESWQSVEP